MAGLACTGFLTGIKGFLGASTADDGGAIVFLGGESSTIRISRRFFAGRGPSSASSTTSIGDGVTKLLGAGGLNGLNILRCWRGVVPGSAEPRPGGRDLGKKFSANLRHGVT